jgi:hypothetical protein
MSKPGRRSILNQKLQKRVCSLLADGSAIRSACLICGIGERTFFDWQTRGKADEEPYARFFSAVTRARERHKANLIQRIVAAAKADWKAASWLLERQFAGEFGRSEPRTVVIERPVTWENGEALPQNNGAQPLQLIVNVVRDENDPVRRLLGHVVVQAAEEEDRPEPANDPFAVNSFPRVPPRRGPSAPGGGF